jgi:serine/threonine protein kinase
VVARRLRSGTVLRADDGTGYRVDGVLGEGGFATTYVGHRLSARGNPREQVCIKVCASRRDWHGEAFFGELLAGDDRVVTLRDAFVAATGSGSAQVRRHVLVFELMTEGTVWEMVEADPRPWTEARTRREVRALLRVLERLHYAGVTHRDLKPDNVYLRDGHLVIGDFGITRMHLDPQHSFASSFAPDFAPMEVLANARWGQADDVYQVGLLAGTLLSGELWWTDSVSVRSIAALEVSDEMKSWLWHATGARRKRYWDAGEAVRALDALRKISLRPGRAPRTLAGHVVTFTGRIPGLPRPDAADRAAAAGATPRPSVSDSTTLLVVGTIKAGSAGAHEGLKLFETRERIRIGQPIKVISAEQFLRLVT